MIKEPIMIDDVDVFKKTIEHHKNNANMTAYEIDNTAYVIQLEKVIFRIREERDQLKAEIRNKNEKIEELRFSVSDLTNRLCNLNAEKSFRIVDYKQALQEIKEIVQNKLNWTADYKTYFKRDNKSIKQEGFKALAEILQKCEEVLKDERNMESN